MVPRATVVSGSFQKASPIVQSTPVSSDTPAGLVTAKAFVHPTSEEGSTPPELPILQQSIAGTSTTSTEPANADRVLTPPPIARKTSTSAGMTPKSPVDVQAVPMSTTSNKYVSLSSLQYQANIHTEPSAAMSPSKTGTANKEMFLDYIAGGCELNVAVAIDFTGSNGDPRQPGKLVDRLVLADSTSYDI